MNITWRDGHHSDYNSQWLSNRRFSQDIRQKRDRYLSVPLKHWGSELEGHIPTETFSNVSA